MFLKISQISQESTRAEDLQKICKIFQNIYFLQNTPSRCICMYLDKEAS